MKVKKFPWIFTVLWLSILAVMMWAGFWQLRRAEEKAQINEKLSLEQNYQPVTETDWLALTAFDPVITAGQYGEIHFLLDNQIIAGQVGQFVFSAFKTIENQWLLINRGWINEDDPELAVNDEMVTINGLVADWPKPGIQLGEQQLSDALVQEVTYLPMEKVKQMMAARVCQQAESNDCIILPIVIKLNPAEEHGFVRKWQLPKMTAEKHHAYAIQWFTMSLVLCLVYGIFIRKTYINNPQQKTDANKN